MKIAVDTRHLRNNSLQEEEYFLYEILKRVINNNPQHEFIFVFDRAVDKKFQFEKNITIVVKGPRASNLLLAKYWYDIRIPAVLKKYKADVFIASHGICSLTTKIPQCLIVKDLSFLYYPSFFKKTDLLFWRHSTKRFLQKANSIIVCSEFLKRNIIPLNVSREEKINVIYGSVPENFYPLNEREKEEIKNKYTGGKNYFLYSGMIHPGKNVMNLLKAFSIFKKRQKSDWKLIIAGDITQGYKSFAESIKTYKHRGDVIRVDGKSEDIPKLTGAAYAFIYPSFWESSGLPILPAMHSHVPVIASPGTAMQEIAGEGALYSNPSDYKDIADKMMLLYKDESLRNLLIDKAKLVTTQYTWEKAADDFWQSILRAIK